MTPPNLYSLPDARSPEVWSAVARRKKALASLVTLVRYPRAPRLSRLPTDLSEFMSVEERWFEYYFSHKSSKNENLTSVNLPIYKGSHICYTERAKDLQTAQMDKPITLCKLTIQ